MARPQLFHVQSTDNFRSRIDIISWPGSFVKRQFKKLSGGKFNIVIGQSDKLLKCKCDPKVGDEVHLEYNRYGKCSGIHLTELDY